ncbi:hypothetical protein [Streptomyces prunicolor]|uniref:hypothetical protein n=1 Tax=Streptomyces prunicolor TaxID=67348 RepID=UPI00131A0075|nr:hypothetical protein [Streptomyces prunicolor]
MTYITNWIPITSDGIAIEALVSMPYFGAPLAHHEKDKGLAFEPAVIKFRKINIGVKYGVRYRIPVQCLDNEKSFLTYFTHQAKQFAATWQSFELPDGIYPEIS